MQPMAKPIGMVPVHRAAALLSATGKPVHPSNISRYLARFKDIPQEKRGKVRLVDFESLSKHRAENVNVIEKEAALPLPGGAVTTDPGAAPPSLGAAEPETSDAPKSGSEANEITLQLKRINLRTAELDLAERERKLIATEEVFGLLSTVMGAFIEALAQQEGEVTMGFGAQVGAEFRRRRKAAQAAAAAKLSAEAQRLLEPADAGKAMDAAIASESSEAA